MLKFVKGAVDMQKMGEFSRKIAEPYDAKNAAQQIFKTIKAFCK